MVLKMSGEKWGDCNHVFTGWKGSLPYFRIQEKGVVDGVNREHLNIYATCDKCGEEVIIGKVHKPKSFCLTKREAVV